MFYSMLKVLLMLVFVIFLCVNYVSYLLTWTHVEKPQTHRRGLRRQPFGLAPGLSRRGSVSD